MAVPVLVLGRPYTLFMPPDVSSNPGPCLVVHVMQTGVPAHGATVLDVQLPHPVNRYLPGFSVLSDCLASVRLPVHEGEGRFGPPVARVPREFLGSLAVFTMPGKAPRAASDPVLRAGTLVFRPGDPGWEWRVDAARNLRLLSDWW